MPPRTLPPALEPHRAFLARLERYFGLSGVRYQLDPPTPDIACAPAAGLILIGRRWHRAGPHEQRKRLTHEAAHLWGMVHDSRARELGYYSNPHRDRWSRRVYEDLLAGSPRFLPSRFGAVDVPQMAQITTGDAPRAPRPNPGPFAAALLTGAGATLGGLITNKAVERMTMKQNPIIEGELVRVPALDAVATVKEVIHGRGLLGGGTQYRVEYRSADGSMRQAIIRSSGVRRLNPTTHRAKGATQNPFSVGELVRLPALTPTGTVKKVIRGGGFMGGGRQYRVAYRDPAGGTHYAVLRDTDMRRLNPSSPLDSEEAAPGDRDPSTANPHKRKRASCPSCSALLQVPRGFKRGYCPSCRARLGVGS